MNVRTRDLVLAGEAFAATGMVVLVLALVGGDGAPQPAPPGLPATHQGAAWLGDLASLASVFLAVVAIGLGLLATGVLDPATDTESAGRAAASVAVAWFAATVLQLGLLTLELRGRATLGEAAETKPLLIQLGAALLAGICWRTARAAAAFLGLATALLGLAIVPIDGHARSASDPVLARIAITLHVSAAALWIGGLVALAWLALTGSGWHAGLRRFSRLAFGCIVAVVVSGVVTALPRVHTFDDLFGSRYGVLIVLKLALLVLLAGAGWLQRRRVVDARAASIRAFVLLAGFELATMAAVLGLAAALSRTPPPA